jgi:hypothetical protein
MLYYVGDTNYAFHSLRTLQASLAARRSREDLIPEVINKNGETYGTSSV